MIRYFHDVKTETVYEVPDAIVLHCYAKDDHERRDGCYVSVRIRRFSASDRPDAHGNWAQPDICHKRYYSARDSEEMAIGHFWCHGPMVPGVEIPEARFAELAAEYQRQALEKGRPEGARGRPRSRAKRT